MYFMEPRLLNKQFNFTNKKRDVDTRFTYWLKTKNGHHFFHLFHLDGVGIFS